jgi:hypothetical protein
MTTAAKRELYIEGRWVDSASAEFQKSMVKMKGEAQRQGRQVGALVNENMGRAMSQFNEKTEKGRQVLTAFGGVIGGAAGQAVYYGGTLTYIVGRFKIWELATMAVVAAIAGLVWLLSRASDEEQRWSDINRQGRKDLEELTKATNDYIRAQQDKRTGLAEVDKKIADLNQKLGEQRDLYEEITNKILSYSSIALAEGDYPKHLAVSWFKAYLRMGEYLGLQDELQKEKRAQLDEEIRQSEHERKEDEARLAHQRWLAKEQERIRRETAAAAEKDRAEAQFMRDLEQMLDEFDREYEAWIAARQKSETEVMAQLERRKDYYQRLWDIEDYWTSRITDKHEKDAKEREANQRRAAENSIEIFATLGDAITQGTKTNTAMRIAAIVLEAGYQAAMEVASGFKALGDMNPWSAAMHFTSAGLFAAVAAGKIATEASGGGGGGGSASMRTREGAHGWEYRERDKQEKTIHIHIDIGRKRFGDAVVAAIEDEMDRDSPGRKRAKVT